MSVGNVDADPLPTQCVCSTSTDRTLQSLIKSRLHGESEDLFHLRVDYRGSESPFLALALTASRRNSHDNMCLHRGEPLMGLFLLVEYFCRLENSHVTAAAALHALATPPPVLADAATAAILALATLPPVLADAFAATVLAQAALPPVRTGHHSAATRAYTRPVGAPRPPPPPPGAPPPPLLLWDPAADHV